MNESRTPEVLDDYGDLLDDGEHRWRKRFVGLMVLLVLAAAGVYALWATVLSGGGSSEATIQTATVQRGSIMKTVSTSGTAVAQSTANLSFSQSGRVTAVNVTLGQAVKQGDVLAEVESDTLQDSLARAEVNLSSAQTKLNQLLEGSSAAELASADQSLIQAQANLDKAQAALEDLLDGPTSDEWDSARQAVLSAESQLTKAQAARADLDSTWEDAIAAAEEAVDRAEEALDNAERAADDAADEVSFAEAKLKGAETAYCLCDNTPSFCAQRAAPISSADESALLAVVATGTPACTLDASSVLTANTAYKSALVAESSADDAVEQAEDDIETAEDNLDELGTGPSSEDIASADAAVAAAELALKMANDKLAELSQGASEDDLVQAQYNVDSATAALVAAQAKRNDTYQGADEEDIASQRDQVQLAQLSVDQAEKDLEKAQLIAPFDGTVAALNITVGDMAGSSGTTAAIVLNTPNAIVLNLSIGESDLPSVKAGQTGTAEFDAITGRAFPIVIDSVGTNPTTTQGVVTYQTRARIVSGQAARGAASGLPAGSPTSQATPQFQMQAASGAAASAAAQPVPGMNASLTIIIDQRQDVLMVPSTAIQRDGRSSVVDIQKEDGSTERVVVETGLSDGTNTEITSGLEEGQTVIIPSLAATTSQSQSTQDGNMMPIFGGPPGEGGFVPGGGSSGGSAR